MITEILRNFIYLQLNLPRQFEFSVRRDHLFEDSHRSIMGVSEKDKDKLKARLYMKFTGESGLDYGGLARYGSSNHNLASCILMITCSSY